MNQVPIIYEDEEIYIINKNAGLSVQGGEGVSHSLDEDFSVQVGKKVFLVHRLDKETCGLMIVSKNPVSAAKWTKLINSKEVQKEYIAIVYGILSEKKGIIKENIIQHGQEKTAKTYYSVEDEFIIDEHKFSKIRLKLQTGRMHQIRIHLAKLGYPIIGDDKHGNFKVNKILKKQYKIKNLLLCSQKLLINNLDKEFEIPLPNYMRLTSE